jgi:D-glycero-alpha-D-manno-heptose 1-phosphate guanylyltransferase
MKAIILVGGFGTRLRSVLPDLPKPMAPIKGKPFLAYLLEYLQQQGITRVIFPVHYLGEKIRAYFQSHYAGIRIEYVEEQEPLGTGGAILNALAVTEDSAEEPVFVLNGDTFVALDYRAMYQEQVVSGSSFVMALRKVDDCSRYGKVMTQDHHVVAFREKGEAGPGYINAGVYLIDPTLFDKYSLPPVFSFEKDFMLPYTGILRPRAFIADDYFIDIGIPEDYARAAQELPVIGG